MDSLGQTKFGVVALGILAGALILWLSISFWFDAWLQHEDADVLNRVVTLDNEFLAVGDDLRQERRATLALLAGKPVTGMAEEPARQALADLQRRGDQRLQALMVAVEQVRQDPSLSRRAWYSPQELGAGIEELADQHRTVVRQRSANQAWFGGGGHAPGRVDRPRARKRALQQAFSIRNRLVEALYALQEGLHVEPRNTVLAIRDLQRLASDLREFVEHAARASDLMLAADVMSLGGDNGPETSEQAVFRAQARTALNRLRLHAGSTSLTPALARRLRELTEEAFVDDAGGEGTMRVAGALRGEVSGVLMHEIHEVKAHARRRLVIDTVLIAVGVWISIACVTLLRSIPRHAWHDRLTGLGNRARTERLLDKELCAMQGKQRSVAVLVLGIDRFSDVNSRVGHDVGDALLRLLAARIDDLLPGRSTLGALGGDHFAIILPDAGELSAVEGIAEKLRTRCAQPFQADGATLLVTLSVGLTLHQGSTMVPDAACTGRKLLLQAEVAMRRAKDDGRNRVQHFDQNLAMRHRDSIRLENDLREAIHGEQLELHYQPKVCSRSGRVSGVEALVRWHHPERGVVSPGLFIPIAEGCGLIPVIGSWVAREAIQRTAQWNRERDEPLQVAVNVSARQFMEDGFVSDVANALQEHGLDSRHLELEVTESVGMMDMQRVVSQLEQLRAMGIRIAIDDFGTDYSCLQYLEEMPLDTLKIDRAFILKLDTSKGRALVGAIVKMARALGLSTVAEGVETAAQLEQVRRLGCDYVQGYHYAAPVPAGELDATIERIQASCEPEARRAA